MIVGSDKEFIENLKADLKEKLDKISQIYILAQEVYLYTEYFHRPNTKGEFNLFTDSIHSIHLCFISHLMFRTLINEVSKLFSSSTSDKYRLESFINSLAKNGHFRKIDFPNAKIELWQEKLDTNKNIIVDIISIRNQVYAHTDKSLNLTNEIEVTFEKIKSLLDFALEVIKGIYIIVFDTHFDEKSPQFDRKNFLILKLLAKAEAQRIEELTNEL